MSLYEKVLLLWQTIANVRCISGVFQQISFHVAIACVLNRASFEFFKMGDDQDGIGCQTKPRMRKKKNTRKVRVKVE